MLKENRLLKKNNEMKDMPSRGSRIKKNKKNYEGLQRNYLQVNNCKKNLLILLGVVQGDRHKRYTEPKLFLNSMN